MRAIARRTAAAFTVAAAALATLTMGSTASAAPGAAPASAAAVVAAPAGTQSSPLLQRVVRGDHVHKVIEGNFPDPGFMKASNGRYYAYATGRGFTVASSDRPSGGFVKHGPSMPKMPAWVGNASDGSPRLWAPHVFQIPRQANGTQFVMYFTGHSRSFGNECVGVATSKGPKGPFVPQSKPLMCARSRGMEMIDPSMYRAADGKRYIIYKVGQYSPTRNFEIRAHPVNSVTGTSLVPRVTSRLLAKSTSAVMEAPNVVRRGNKVYLFMSRNGYLDCNYSTQVWVADKLWGGKFRPLTTLSMKAPVSGKPFCGPGGAEVIRDGSTYRIAFHTWKDFNPATKTRPMWTGELRWTATGVPYLY